MTEFERQVADALWDLAERTESHTRARGVIGLIEESFAPRVAAAIDAGEGSRVAALAALRGKK
jgi:hypothetical protein